MSGAPRTVRLRFVRPLKPIEAHVPVEGAPGEDQGPVGFAQLLESVATRTVASFHAASELLESAVRGSSVRLRVAAGKGDSVDSTRMMHAVRRAMARAGHDICAMVHKEGEGENGGVVYQIDASPMVAPRWRACARFAFSLLLLALIFASLYLTSARLSGALWS
jgi:hypothetical protein